ncbi:MAG: hypothetical protein EAZ47_00420 [Bacteroidetes bacterium]|nr:MAG: hypothetical protein EAZ47_00420 [Bacteroidota bacterium]
MGKLFTFIIILITAASCVTRNKANNTLQTTYSKEQVSNDLQLLEKVLMANHPGLHVFIFQQELEVLKDSIIQQLPAMASIHQARNAVATYVAAIGCGHTSVRYSKAMMRAGGKATPSKQFPLGVKVWGDSAVVLFNLWGRADTAITQGTILTHINGIRVDSLLHQMRTVVSTDGSSLSFKDQFISNSFGSLYKTFYPNDTSLSVRFIAADGQMQDKYIPYYKAPKNVSNAVPTVRIPTPKPSPWVKQNASLLFQPATETAILSIHSFEGNKGLRRFIKKAFEEIEKRGTKNLIIDLRRNTGGRISLATLLTKYVANTSFHVADSVYTSSKKIALKQYVKPHFAYGLHKWLFTKKISDSVFTVPYFANKKYHPTTQHHFDGNIYYLTGGYTFSAATLHLHFVHKQPNVTLIGEETGGNYYALNAVHIPDIELPNTLLRVRLPLYRQVFDSSRTFTSKGFLPTYQVLPSSEAIKRGIDAKMQKAFDIIKATAQ